MSNTDKSVTVPTVHLNGTSGESLLEAIRTARVAVRAAERALYECAPHGRDYYVQTPDRFAAAQAEHAARCNRLCETRLELEAISAAIGEQMNARIR